MKIPVGIPVFVAAAGIDPKYARLVHRYVVSAVAWLLFLIIVVIAILNYFVIRRIASKEAR